MDRIVTGITVFYKTTDLIWISIGSFRKFYPTLPLIVVDNSGGDDCTATLESFQRQDPNMTLIKVDRNIGHGLGLRRALKYVQTPYVYVFDSDVEILRETLLEEMLEKMQPGVYGTGYIRLCTSGGQQKNDGDLNDPDIVRYMHPLSCMISMKMYKKFRPPNTGGAPFADIMTDLKKAGLTNTALVHFPVLPHGHYIKHHGGITRAMMGGTVVNIDYQENEYNVEIIWGAL